MITYKDTKCFIRDKTINSGLKYIKQNKNQYS